MVNNLGAIIGAYALHEAHSVITHSEIDVFYAPSECHGLVAEHEEKELVELEKRLGMSLDEAITEGEKRLNPNTMKRYWDECVSRILFRDHPMLDECDRRRYDV